MYQLTDDPGAVIRLADGARIPRGHRWWEDYAAWLAAGNVALPLPPPYVLHSPQHYQAIRNAAWAWMTAFVQGRRYDSVESCCSYANSTVPRYRQEAMAMIQWRDAVNQALEALVVAPPDGIETWTQVQAMMPQPDQFAWPEALELPMDLGNEVAGL